MSGRRTEVRQQMQFRISGAPNTNVPVELYYTKIKPHEVELNFLPDNEGDETEVWIIGRTLLKKGLNTRRGRMVGLSDVKIGTSTQSKEIVIIQLLSPDGSVECQAQKKELRSFLRRTTKIVPFDKELDSVGVDEEIARMLYSSDD